MGLDSKAFLTWIFLVVSICYGPSVHAQVLEGPKNNAPYPCDNNPNCRVVNILAVVDKKFAEKIKFPTPMTTFDRSRNVATRLVKEASYIFERDFSIRLNITNFHPEELDVNHSVDLVSYLREEFPDEALDLAQVDMLLYFTNRDQHDSDYGEAPYLGRRGFIRGYNAVVLAHEIGHMFGATHVSRCSGIMSADSIGCSFVGFIKRDFDPINEKIITLMRNRDFKQSWFTSDENKKMIEIISQLGQRREQDTSYQVAISQDEKASIEFFDQLWIEMLQANPKNKRIREMAYNIYMSRADREHLTASNYGAIEVVPTEKEIQYRARAQEFLVGIPEPLQ